VELFDPLLNVIEQNLLTNLLKIDLLSENNEGKYEVNCEGYFLPANANVNTNDTMDDSSKNKEISTHNFVLCFLPHCPRSLYNNLLHTNWNKDHLSRLIIIGNSFSQYDDIATNLSEREKEDMNYILSSTKLNIVKEQSLDDCIMLKNQFQNSNETRESLLKVNIRVNDDDESKKKQIKKRQQKKKTKSTKGGYSIFRYISTKTNGVKQKCICVSTCTILSNGTVNENTRSCMDEYCT